MTKEHAKQKYEEEMRLIEEKKVQAKDDKETDQIDSAT